MDDDLSQPQAVEGIRITGAQEALPAEASRPTGGDDGVPRTGQSSQPTASWDDEDDEPWDDEWLAAEGDVDHSPSGAKADHVHHDDDAGDESSWPSATDASAQIRPDRSPAPAPGSEPSDRAVNIDEDMSQDEGRSSWSSFAGQGPRWRNNADDWDDGDGDGSLIHDDDTRIGALDPDRSDESDLYTFDDLPAKEVAKQAVGGEKVAARSGGRRAVRRRSDASAEPVPASLRATGSGTRPGQRRPAGGTGKPAGTTRPGDRSGGGSMNGNGNGRDSAPTSMGARVGTGVVLLGGALLVLIFLKRPGGVILITLALTLAVLELFTALRQRGFQPAIIPAGAGVALMPFVAYNRGSGGLLITLILATMTCLLWYLVGVVRDRPAVNMAVSVLGVLYVGVLGSTGGLILQHPKGVTILLGAVVGTVAYDVCGYFVGANAGKIPLAPEISPNKTVEGLVFGMIGAILVCTAVFARFRPFHLKEAALLGLVVAVMAPLGDLCESMIKRDLGIKDMGTVLPGHGGILDRIDAMLFVMPAVYFLALKVL